MAQSTLYNTSKPITANCIGHGKSVIIVLIPQPILLVVIIIPLQQWMVLQFPSMMTMTMMIAQTQHWCQRLGHKQTNFVT